MVKAGFHRVGLMRYTGFKSSPYTEGALFYGEKPAAGQARDDTIPQTAGEVTPLGEAACKPGGT
jgi:hypothetical protein